MDRILFLRIRIQLFFSMRIGSRCRSGSSLTKLQCDIQRWALVRWVRLIFHLAENCFKNLPHLADLAALAATASLYFLLWIAFFKNLYNSPVKFKALSFLNVTPVNGATFLGGSGSPKSRSQLGLRLNWVGSGSRQKKAAAAPALQHC